MSEIDARLPCEDLDAGLYIWQRTENRPGVEVLTLSHGDEDRYYVPVEDFMAVQKERDDFRRACALINAWTVNPERSLGDLRRLLNDVGLTHDDALAMASLVEAVKAGELHG